MLCTGSARHALSKQSSEAAYHGSSPALRLVTPTSRLLGAVASLRAIGMSEEADELDRIQNSLLEAKADRAGLAAKVHHKQLLFGEPRTL